MGMPQAVHRFTVDEYHRMGEAGIFHEDDRVELIRGRIVHMSPIGHRHAGCVTYLTNVLVARLQERAIVSPQNPVIIAADSEPQPDVAVLRPSPEFYRDRHPTPADVLLMIEVSDSSLEFDRGEKLALCAETGIAEVWLVSLPEQNVSVHRGLQAGRYTDVSTRHRDETVSPLAFPDVSLRVDDILG